MKTTSRYRWVVVGIFFLFMLLHQTDKLLIGSLTTRIMNEFQIDEVQMGAIFTSALVVGAVMYLVWGYLYDRYARAKLLALASFIWGATTWISAIARTYPTFLASRASTGVDDSSYPGLYSLIADYFGPEMRGKVFGLLQLSQPLGFMIGLIIATQLVGTVMGWRTAFYITGSLGLVMAIVIYFGVREPVRGQSEPELADLAEIGVYRFSWPAALNLLRRRSIWFLFLQGFVGVFPWNVITYWFFRYLEVERNYSPDAILITMGPAVLVLAGGYFVGGVVGDALFKRTPRGRMLTALIGVLSGAILLNLTLRVPVANQSLFLVMMMATALFIPFASPNVVSTIYDITLPEVRSSALSIQYLIESSGRGHGPAAGRDHRPRLLAGQRHPPDLHRGLAGRGRFPGRHHLFDPYRYRNPAPPVLRAGRIRASPARRARRRRPGAGWVMIEGQSPADF